MIVAIVPAVTEPGIDNTIRSLLAQTVQPDRIIVALNNTDNPDTTHTPALSIGDPRIEVIDHGTCPGRKAEAINRTLTMLDRTSLVMVTDADTELTPGFIEAALAELEDPEVGAVGAVFQADDTATGWLGLCQKLEWERYREEIDRTGRTFVLSGTAAVLRWDALETVRERYGRWYDERSITEDMEIGIALKQCGWQLRSPVACRVVTETMPTVADLLGQRRRWSLGALQNIRAHGLSRITAMYVRQQIMLAVSIALLWTLIGLTVAAIAMDGPVVPHPFWLLIGAIFATERVLTVWDQPIRHRLFAALVLPELAYALAIQVSHVAAWWQFLRRHEGTWTHVQPTQRLTLKGAV